jgi:D-alanyl-D-alanine carboxypeptidase
VDKSAAHECKQRECIRRQHRGDVHFTGARSYHRFGGAGRPEAVAEVTGQAKEVEMKTLNQQKLDVTHKARSNIFGQIAPDSKPLEFEGFRRLMSRIISLVIFFRTFSTFAVVMPEEIGQQIDAILGRAEVSNVTWSISIQNLRGSMTYYERHATNFLTPASNTKLYTTATAFARLSPSHRFQTDIYAKGPITDGILAGDLILISEHDFTWSTRLYPKARVPLEQMAEQCHSRGLRRVTGKIIVRGECALDERTSKTNAAAVFKTALTEKGISVEGEAVGEDGFAKEGELYTSWQSVPLEAACKPLNTYSINAFADLLLKHIGWKLAGTNSYDAGAMIVTNWLQSIDLDPGNIVMRDGSGLSHENKFSAAQTLELVRYMRNNFPTFDDTFTVGCVVGTIGKRFCGTPAAGNVHGKTGTLRNVVALSGYVYNESDEHTYYFSFLANDVSDSTAGRKAIDDAVVVMTQSGILNDDVEDRTPPTQNGGR